jgi:hypothetical protein
VGVGGRGEGVPVGVRVGDGVPVGVRLGAAVGLGDASGSAVAVGVGVGGRRVGGSSVGVAAASGAAGVLPSPTWGRGALQADKNTIQKTVETNRLTLSFFSFKGFHFLPLIMDTAAIGRAVLRSLAGIQPFLKKHI